MYIPMMLCSGPLAGYFLGRWSEQRFQTSKIVMLLLILMGFIAAIFESIRIIQRISREK